MLCPASSSSILVFTVFQDILPKFAYIDQETGSWKFYSRFDVHRVHQRRERLLELLGKRKLRQVNEIYGEWCVWYKELHNNEQKHEINV